MYKKLCILLMGKYHTHKLYAIFAKFLNICKQVAGNFDYVKNLKGLNCQIL